MSHLILHVRLAARALRWWLTPPSVGETWAGLLSPPLCSAPLPQCGRKLSAGNGYRQSAGTRPEPHLPQIIRAGATASYPANPLHVWDGLYRPGIYPRHEQASDDSGLITAVRSVVGPSTTRFIDDLFNPVIEQVRGRFDALAFQYRGEAA